MAFHLTRTANSTPKNEKNSSSKFHFVFSVIRSRKKVHIECSTVGFFLYTISTVICFVFECRSSNFTNTKLKVVCGVLDLEKKGTHTDLVDRILTFLVAPKNSGKVSSELASVAQIHHVITSCVLFLTEQFVVWYTFVSLTPQKCKQLRLKQKCKSSCPAFMELYFCS